MPARPLQCRFCKGVFLPVSEQSWVTVQCPHCSAQMKVGECEPAEVQCAPEGQACHPATERDGAAARPERTHNRWTGRLVILACVVPLLGLLAFAVNRLTGGKTQNRTEIVRTHQEANDAERQEVHLLARAFLGADNWLAVLPLVADAPRVRSTMEWYYANRPWRRAAGHVKIGGIERMYANGREMLRVQATTEQRPVMWLLLVREGRAWKVDWEFFTDAAAVRWQSFVSEEPGGVVELPLLVTRKPAPEITIMKAGVQTELHDAVVLQVRERQSPAVAVLAKDSPLWRDLDGIDFEKPVHVIARVTMVSPEFDPPLVKLEAIVQKGWLRPAQSPVAGGAAKE
jgi:phage FluMu protein Com